jgi:hypothetical protein
MTLITRNTEQLTRLENPSGNVLVHVRNPITKKDHHVLLSDIRSGNSYGTWNPEEEYSIYNRVTWNFKIWESLQDNNEGNIPRENAFWTEVSADEIEDLQTVDVSGSTPVINLASNRRMQYVGSASIGGNKTFSLANEENALSFKFILTLSAVYYLQWPSSFKMSDALWNSSTKRWTPEQAGTYVAEAIKDGTNWYLNISNPYT